MGAMPRRMLGYVGGLLILVSVAVFITASKETQYETGVARLKGTVIGKEIRPFHTGRGRIYGVTYRVTVQGRILEREGDVGSEKAWDSIRVGDEVEVEAVGVTANETRLAAERVAGSGVYRGIASGIGVAGLVLIGVRILWRGKGDR